jgi:hypothetical protein
VPNENKQLNFTLKVYDKVNKQYRPVYVAPDATDYVQGDVKLSDLIESTDTLNINDLNAENGMTAATPKAVGLVQKNAETKLSTIVTAAQSVASDVTFNKTVTSVGGFTGNLTGDVEGNATSAKQAEKLDHKIMLQLVSGSNVMTSNDSALDSNNSTLTVNLDGKVSVSSIDASSGKLPLSVIPEAALERIVSYADLGTAAKAYLAEDDADKPFQIGDTVRTLDDNIMHIVIKAPTSETDTSWCVDYAAGTSATATQLALEGKVGSNVLPVYFSEGLPVACDSTLDISITGNAATATKLNGNNAGSSTLPVYFSNGSPVACSTTLGVTITGKAAALTLTSAVGSTTQPVYFSKDGKPVACGSSLAVDITGNAATATAAASLSDNYIVVSSTQPTNSNAIIWIETS